MGSFPVDVAATGDVYHGYGAGFDIDPADDPVCTATRAEPVIHGQQQAFADAVRLLQQWSRDELVGCGSNGLRQSLSESTTDCRSGPKLVGLVQ